jgi:hypothetical protein
MNKLHTFKMEEKKMKHTKKWNDPSINFCLF